MKVSITPKNKYTQRYVKYNKSIKGAERTKKFNSSQKRKLIQKRFQIWKSYGIRVKEISTFCFGHNGEVELKQMQLHHITGNHKSNEYIWLCEDCHLKVTDYAQRKVTDKLERRIK